MVVVSPQLVEQFVLRLAQHLARVNRTFRGKPDGFDTAGGAFHWGTGIGFPSRNFLRVTAELNGAHVMARRGLFVMFAPAPWAVRPLWNTAEPAPTRRRYADEPCRSRPSGDT